MLKTIRLNGIEYKIPVSIEKIWSLNPKGKVILWYPPKEYELKSELCINDKTIIVGTTPME